MSETVICSNCNTICTVEEIHCHNCGKSLRDPSGIMEQTIYVPTDEEEPATFHSRRAYFGRDMNLELEISETKERVKLEFAQFLTLGRGQSEEPNTPFFDLNAYDAAEKGVSRRHVRFFRLNITMMVEDLGTLNGTFLNGERLTHGQSYIICDGDELKLGKLPMRVMFTRGK